MRRRLNIKNNWESYEYYLDDKRITIDEIRALKQLDDKDGYFYEIVKVASENTSYSDHGHTYSAQRYVIYVQTQFGVVRVSPNHEFYVELPELATLESIAEYWRGYFMEEDDSVHMTMAEHKKFAEECEEAGITALDVYKYLGV